VSIATHFSTFIEHDAEKSVTIDPMHTHCTWYEFYQIRIKRNKWEDTIVNILPVIHSIKYSFFGGKLPI
jgi:hypothetical protein